MSSKRRRPLTRARALEAAVDLADAEGIAAVSMRNLADHLEVVPMALYKHVANKDDLLGGMIDRVIEQYARPDTGVAWSPAVRAVLLSARTQLLAHPWLRTVIESRHEPTRAVLGYQDSLAGIFLGAGFGADLTHHVMHLLGNRIWGFSPEAFNPPADAPPPSVTPDDRRGEIDAIAAAYPNIAAIAMAATGGDLSLIDAGCDEQFEFEFALDVLLEAIDRLQASGWTSLPR